MGIRAGSKVICIDASGFSPKYGEIMPVKGKVYTVRDTLSRAGTHRCFRLREIVNKPAKYAQGLIECSFKDSRFTATRGK